MESRTRWRKGEPGVREGVAGLVDALREGIGALALALFDDDRADAGAATDRRPISFLDAFPDLPCADLEWQTHYAALRATGRFETTCACAVRHPVSGFLIHERWVLIMVGAPALAPGAAAALASGLAALADRLPPGKPRDVHADHAWYRDPPEERSGGGRLPMLWVRRPRE